jgi:hypothetical protein
MAHRAGSTVSLARGASHVPMQSQPKQTLDTIMEAIKHVD